MVKQKTKKKKGSLLRYFALIEHQIGKMWIYSVYRRVRRDQLVIDPLAKLSSCSDARPDSVEIGVKSRARELGFFFLLGRRCGVHCGDDNSDDSI